MKSTIIVFVCILYCQAAVITGPPIGGKDAEIDGKDVKLPPVTEITEPTIGPNGRKGIPVGPTLPTTTITPNTTTLAPNTTTLAPNTTTLAPNTTTQNPKTTTTTLKPTTPNTTTVTPKTTTAAPNTTTTSEKPTTKKPIPSSTESPITTTPVSPPANRGFDGPSFIGGIVLASGLMAIGFVALKFYRARTELNYHTL